MGEFSIIEWKQMTVEIDRIIRSRRKTLALIVQPDGTLIVRAPYRASHASILDFIDRNSSWIERKRAQARAAIPYQPNKYIEGMRFDYLGIAYPLEMQTEQGTGLVLSNGKFMLAVDDQQQAKLEFERWYRRQAKKIITERVNSYAGQHGFQYSKIGITSARTRWGSCSATGSLNFSWRLIQAPMDMVNYVVVHELVHTAIHNHSKRFWNRVEKILPDYREHRMWLQKNGHLLLV